MPNEKQKQFHTLVVEDNNIYIVKRQHILGEILNKLNTLIEYNHILEELVYDNQDILENLLSTMEKEKNHNPSLDHDSHVKF